MPPDRELETLGRTLWLRGQAGKFDTTHLYIPADRYRVRALTRLCTHLQVVVDDTQPRLQLLRVDVEHSDEFPFESEDLHEVAGRAEDLGVCQRGRGGEQEQRAETEIHGDGLELEGKNIIEKDDNVLPTSKLEAPTKTRLLTIFNYQ